MSFDMSFELKIQTNQLFMTIESPGSPSGD